jgi:tRNA G18 (ribose-2'-O)-methylase SpoU
MEKCPLFGSMQSMNSKIRKNTGVEISRNQTKESSVKNQKNSKKRPEVFVLLHDIRSIHNVGSIFRTADALGVKTIFLSGYTATPIDRYGREVKELSKVALGGELSVGWEKVENLNTFFKKFTSHKNNNSRDKQQKNFIIALEQDKKSVDYKKLKIPKSVKSVLVIVGNEVAGISKEILKKADVIAEIPMNGKKESLNVGVSFGIAAFRILNK